MTKMAGVPRARAWFTKSTVSWTPKFEIAEHHGNRNQNRHQIFMEDKKGRNRSGSNCCDFKSLAGWYLKIASDLGI